MKSALPPNPLVSIVILHLGDQQGTEQTISSALSQSYPNIEILVVGDDLPDGMKSMLDSPESRIRFLAPGKQGAASCLNFAISQMRGDFLSWIRSEDMFGAEEISRNIEAWKQSTGSEAIVITESDSRERSDDISFLNDETIGQSQAWLTRKTSRKFPLLYLDLENCRVLVHKDVLRAVGLFDPAFEHAYTFEFLSRALTEFPSLITSPSFDNSADPSTKWFRGSSPENEGEYCDVLSSVLESLNDREIGELAPSKLDLYQDLERLYSERTREKAMLHLGKLLLSHLHINYTDLKGRRFNGYDLIGHLQQRGIRGSQIVWTKESSSPFVSDLHQFDANRKFIDYVSKIEDAVGIKAQTSPLMQDILHHPTFLRAGLLHLHILHHPAFNLNYLPVMTRLKPTIWSIHDPWILSGHCVHHDKCEQWKSGCGNCPQLDSLFSIPHDNSALQFTIKKDIVSRSNFTALAASKWLETQLKESSIFEGKRIVRIPFGVDQSLFAPGDRVSARKKLGIGEDEFVLLARSQSAFKGTNLVAEVATRVSFERSVVLIAVGELGNFRSLPRNVRLIEKGWVESPELIADLYRACDIFLMPSYQETFGLMAVEAMSCGRVVIALDTPNSALPEVIGSPSAGIAFPEAGFVESVVSLARRPDELLSREREALSYARKNYRLDTYLDEVENLYRESVESFVCDRDSRYLHQQLDKASNDYRNSEKPRSEMSRSFSIGGIDLLSSSDWKKCWEFFRRQGPAPSIRQAFRILRQQ